MPEIGQTISHYRIIEKLGQGGMGEVFLAHDASLDRKVALKFLPDIFSGDPERLARFEREAKLLASLNHPNIAAIYGFEHAAARRFLAMELVEGETLAERIAKGALPVEEALEVCRQIAEGVEAAHEKGVIHRDLKPANVKITPGGKVKVLDFGLAKAFQDDVTVVDASHSPTLTEQMTRPGVILGTAAYMSPEQAKGKGADRRADLWAFGCILFECLAGRRAFEGETATETMANILRAEPDWSALPADTPRRIRILLERCLRKDPRRRLHDAADARIEIEDARDAGEPGPAAPARSWKSLIAPMIFSLAAGATIASAWWWLRSGPAAGVPKPARFALPLVSGVPPFGDHWYSTLAISPDGQTIVYAAKQGQKNQLFLRPVDQSEAKLLQGTEGAAMPFFSPDGQHVGFFTIPDNQLKRVAVSGGSPSKICNYSGSDLLGASWGTDNLIRFVPDFGSGIYVVPAGGGTAQVLLPPNIPKDRYVYAWPHVLPENKGLIFAVASGNISTWDDAGIFILESGAKEPRLLIQGGSQPQYLPTGHILYARAGALLAVSFSLSRLERTGTPFPLPEGIPTFPLSGDANYAISSNGTLIYEPGGTFRGNYMLALVDRKGKARPIYEKPGFYMEGSLSQYGRIAMRVAAAHDDIWTFDLAQPSLNRFTHESGDEFNPLWTPDASHIAYGLRVAGTEWIYWRKANENADAELLSKGEYPRLPSSFSRDGKLLAFEEIHKEKQRDIWLLSLEGQRKEEPFQATAADEFSPKFSPAGSWLVYVSNETENNNEVYVRPTGSPGLPKKISANGGTWPLWSRDGREIYYVNGKTMMMVSFNEKTGQCSPPEPMFEIDSLERCHIYGLTEDGNQFVMSIIQLGASPTHFQVVENWFEVLMRHVPSGSK